MQNIDQEGDVLDENGKSCRYSLRFCTLYNRKRRGFTVHGAHEPHFIVTKIKSKR